MVSQRAPPVVLRPLYQPGLYGVEINIGQTVDQGIAVLHQHALEALAPEEAFAAVAFIVPAREALFDLFIESSIVRPSSYASFSITSKSDFLGNTVRTLKLVFRRFLGSDVQTFSRSRI